MNQQSTPVDGLQFDRRSNNIPNVNKERPPPFQDTEDGQDTDDEAGTEGWTFFEFLSGWEQNNFKEELWWKFDKNEIIGFESEGRKMFLGIAEIVISFHERKMFSGNLVRRIRILPDLNVTHKPYPQTDKRAFENGGQKSDIDHFRWMVAALIRAAYSRCKISSKFLLFFSKIFISQERFKYYFVSQLYHPIFFNSSDRCNLIRMMRDLYNLNPYIFRTHFKLESYGFKDWWLKITCRPSGDTFHRVLKYNANYKCLYYKSNGFALPLYIRNVHEHFSQRQGYHECIDLEIDNLFPGVSAAIVDSAIRNLHNYWGLFGSTTTTTLPYLQRNSPYGWCFPEYRYDRDILRGQEFELKLGNAIKTQTIR